MKYFSLTFDRWYNDDINYAKSKDGSTIVALDKFNKLLVKESELSMYFEKYDINRAEYVGTTIK